MNQIKTSKVFRYKKGHVSSECPTIQDMIDFFSQFDDKSMPVKVEWELQKKSLGEATIQDKHHEGTESESCDVLFINVDY
jgi:hypothetical protein